MTDWYTQRQQLRKELRDSISETLEFKPYQVDPTGNYCDCWHGYRPGFFDGDNPIEVQLCVEFLPTLLSRLTITHLECSPQRQGIGTKVVNTIIAFAKTHNLTVRVDNAYASAIPFWQRFPEVDLVIYDI
jgi:GNAT superfamily N-acetyltransferase